jgi:hypothetical protein
MEGRKLLRELKRIACSLVVAVVVSSGSTAWGKRALPDFDAVAFVPVECDHGQSSEPVGDLSPAAADLVGEDPYAAVFTAWDSDFLYFRYRVNGDPSGSDGFRQYAWYALMQVPSGNEMQYQYALVLNGMGGPDDFGNSGSDAGDTIEIWANPHPEDFDFDPIFKDTAETRLFAQRYDFSSVDTVNGHPLARWLPTGDGSAFEGDEDYFVDFAIPVTAMVANGVISDASDLDQSQFLNVTSTNENNYNKDVLDCQFPGGEGKCKEDGDCEDGDPCTADTCVDKQCQSTPISGCCQADSDCDDSNACTVDSCTAGVCENVAIGGCTPCVVDADCDDSNACTTDSCTAGVCENVAIGGCTPCVVDADCDDSNACTVDSCTAGVCENVAIDGCTPCVSDADCDDGNACTVDSCTAGVCENVAIGGCTPCVVDADCNDSNACTVDSCTAGVCENVAIAGCGACASDADCDDSNACTVDECDDRRCEYEVIGAAPPA